MHLSDFCYDLPEDLIAQLPTEERDKSRLMVVDRQKDKNLHGHFYQILDHLPKKSLIVVNDTQVIPARFTGIKKLSGGKIEVLFLRPTKIENTWEVMVKGKVKEFTQILLVVGKMSGVLKKKLGNGCWLMEIDTDEDIYSLMESSGEVPLPPYIKRQGKEGAHEKDTKRYQTVYARNKGAIAAPTAGLHFTEKILEDIKNAGIEIVSITLHVGVGTFSPIRTDNVLQHDMEPERYSISESAAVRINKAKENGCKIVAVGTTTTRALESVADSQGKVAAGERESKLMIIPGYRFKVVDALITNFHLPKSTLLLLVSAFAKKERIFAAYEEAIKLKYRFYSYGDGMLIK